ncbi:MULTISPECIES: D-erythronate dehydrogenase [Halomonadaceae]|jgi:nucleoside-diphosphate-sugar epimerase|uniref:SDR family oxidoreductase n=1 Tax=Vreelandella janggokensis TaxID=370767 RepID=A0ABT4IPR6_9GAMM|nr:MULTISPECIES: D-erythronate dehydrogenase [Halomonas]MCW4153656.1 SDR family oxidoreductase [Halomonas sp. 18H]MCZ0925652.1 SDR family oxidoreductase [Halomonas janggokensis]MDR5886840.1 SDR family oxidoreductase [Halomonas janggokensis]QPL47321.1 SDR family oxidoreductase [Halomonas sp. A40-4]
MHIAITGAAGFLGQRLVHQLLARGELRQQPITRLTLIDQVEAPQPEAGNVAVTPMALDITEPGALDRVFEQRPDVIYHLAAVVSSAAEADFDLGLRVNFDATRALLEACRQRELSDTRLIMASSVAAYGGDLPEVLDDMTALHPQNSYGAQKAMSELLVNDYSRRGLVDGLVLRLPTIVIRPGRPNAAASSFASSILREPLNGEEAICPVPVELPMFVMSPGKVVDALVHGAEVPGEALGTFRAFMLPGITITVAEMLEALRDAAGEKAFSLVRHEPDPRIEAIVASWPARFDTAKAKQLGFVGDENFKQIIDAFVTERA